MHYSGYEDVLLPDRLRSAQTVCLSPVTDMASGKTRVTVALDAGLLDLVDALGRERGQDRDHVIEKMIRRELRWAERRRKDREIQWSPDWIILKARELRAVAKHLETGRADEVDSRVGLSR